MINDIEIGWHDGKNARNARQIYLSGKINTLILCVKTTKRSIFLKQKLIGKLYLVGIDLWSFFFFFNLLKHDVTVFFFNGNINTVKMTVDLINNYNNSPLFCIQIIALYNSNKYINKSPFDIQSRIRKKHFGKFRYKNNVRTLPKYFPNRNEKLFSSGFLFDVIWISLLKFYTLG